MTTYSYIGMTAANPQVIRSDVVAAGTGGTLAGGQVVQVVFSNDVFTGTAESKQRLAAAIRFILERLETTTVFPLTSAS